MTSMVTPLQTNVTASSPLNAIAPAALTSHSGERTAPAEELQTTSTSFAAIGAVRFSVVAVVPPLKNVWIEHPVRSMGIDNGFLISSALLLDDPSTYSLKKMFSILHVELQPSPSVVFPSSHCSHASRTPSPHGCGSSSQIRPTTNGVT